MTAKKIDKILAEEDELMPSSGFLSSVMERVEEEAAAPPPLPFPWKRAVPGMVLAGGGLGWCVYQFAQMANAAAGHVALPALHLSTTFNRPLQQIGWVGLALGAALISWLFAKRMAGRSGML
ncbi:MAG TPA: hypothetical protein VLZ50_13150 [Terracidiphilus sp.]|nr:hypothetical protein [Terracidiphilus sp.]